MKKKLTMTEAAFYRLYTAHREAKKNGTALALIPVHAFMGEVYCEEVGLWGYISYECSARLSEIYSDNPGLVYREMMTGKSGAEFYGYRIAEGTSIEAIRDSKLRALYDRCRRYWLGCATRDLLEGARAKLPIT